MTDLSLVGKRKAIQLVGFASGQGASDTRCEAAPDALRAMHLTARLRARGFRARWTSVIRPAAGDRSDALKAVRKICTRLAELVERIVNEGDMPIVVGGDHTSAIGTWKGIAHARLAQGRVGLLWIDGDHSYEGVKRDFCCWSQHLTDDATVAFDDATDPTIGPCKIIDELLESGLFRKTETVNKITVLKKMQAA